tara:strand:+ start:107 stop:667 length:561 start_codon:yes stop_codon:yes gene_type:complete
MRFFLLFILVNFFSFQSNAEIGKETGFEIPRYISLKSNDANIRVGPSINYPIAIKFIVKNYPLKIIEEYNDWRKVEDFNNKVGWVHKSLLSGKRTGIVLSNNNNFVEVSNTNNGSIIGKLGKGNVVNIIKCKIKWCLISFDNYKGWINKDNIWGLKKNEVININYFQIFEDIYWKSLNIINNNINF